MLAISSVGEVGHQRLEVVDAVVDEAEGAGGEAAVAAALAPPARARASAPWRRSRAPPAPRRSAALPAPTTTTSVAAGSMASIPGVAACEQLPRGHHHEPAARKAIELVPPASSITATTADQGVKRRIDRAAMSSVSERVGHRCESRSARWRPRDGERDRNDGDPP